MARDIIFSNGKNELEEDFTNKRSPFSVKRNQSVELFLTESAIERLRKYTEIRKKVAEYLTPTDLLAIRILKGFEDEEECLIVTGADLVDTTEC